MAKAVIHCSYDSLCIYVTSLKPPRNGEYEYLFKDATNAPSSLIRLLTMLAVTVFLSVLAATAAAYTDIVHKRFMLKNIDPIVFPGQYISHMHSFFGSDAVTKDLPSTEELQKGCPSGENPNDLSIYCQFNIVTASSYLNNSS